MVPHIAMTRRALFGLGAAAAGAVVLPGPGPAWADSLIDPYSGTIPLTFPLVEGTYQSPLSDNWHAAREGRTYPWNHVSDGRRAHDGVDIYPLAGAAPTVYAPLAGIVAAICLRSANTVDASVTYQASPDTPPPWDYSQAVDNIAGLPLYGNFVWLYSTDERSNGYFVFCCHLDNEPTIQALSVDQPVSEQTRIGVVGDTGNAAGTPQLHVEIHDPRGSSYPCRRCTPQTLLTSIDPAASLRSATPRPLAVIWPTLPADRPGRNART